ncbi:hypothetical protein GCM10009759_13360 [Kitasatospora saccharophila]
MRAGVHVLERGVSEIAPGSATVAAEGGEDFCPTPRLPRP